MSTIKRRQFIRDLGFSSAALPFLSGLPGLRAESKAGGPKKRIIIMFSPNGTIPDAFWPKTEGEGYELPTILDGYTSNFDLTFELV